MEEEAPRAASGEEIAPQAGPTTHNSPRNPYLFVASFIESKKIPPTKPPPQTRTHRMLQPQMSAGSIPRPRTPRTSTCNPPKPQFLVQFPKPVKIEEDGAEPWTLRCVCEEKQGIGLLMQCEKCGNWQHAICVGLNDRTIPEKYICEVCGNRPIRCKCNNNINYRFALIQCTVCGYYVHRRCVGLLYGPMPRGDYVCTFCGKSKFTYARVKLPVDVEVEDTTFTFTPEKTENLPSQVLSGPFGDFLTIDVAEATLKARDFCESFYDRFRSFFFVCHPLNPNAVSKKKRYSLFTSFMSASEYLFDTCYGVNHEKFREVFDALLTTDLYKPLSMIKDANQSSGCEISENTRFELARLTNILKIKEGTMTINPNVTVDGCFAPVDLKQDTFIGAVEGFIGDLEEFNYDSGVDSGWFQISDTRLVLDATHVPGSLLHRMKRSMNGNCVLKLIEVGEQVLCGLFVGRAGLSSQKIGEELSVKAGEPLYLGIDFLPAVLEDVSKWIGWHCPDLEEHGGNRPSRDERELQAAIRQSEVPKRVKPLKPKKKDSSGSSSKKSRGRKMKRKVDFGNGELGLFDLFDAEGPCEYLFTVTDNVEEYQKRMSEAAAQPKQMEAKRHKPESTKPKPHQTQSTPIPQTEKKPPQPVKPAAHNPTPPPQPQRKVVVKREVVTQPQRPTSTLPPATTPLPLAPPPPKPPTPPKPVTSRFEIIVDEDLYAVPQDIKDCNPIDGMRKLLFQ